MLELQRRSMASDLSLTSVAAHPGYAATNLQQSGPAMGGATVGSRTMAVLNRVVAQPAAHGAWPLLMAGTQPGLPGGSFVGPGAMFEQRGRPRLVGMSSPASTPPSPAGCGRPASAPPASASPSPRPGRRPAHTPRPSRTAPRRTPPRLVTATLSQGSMRR